jgi:hypothetical protein
MPIARLARRAAMLFMAGQDPDAEWEQPTGDYTVKLYRDDGFEVSGTSYAAQTVAVTGAFAIVEGSGDTWSVKNAATPRFPASGEAGGEWTPIAEVRFYRTGQTEPDIIFELDAIVVVTAGTHYFIDSGELTLFDSAG